MRKRFVLKNIIVSVVAASLVISAALASNAETVSELPVKAVMDEHYTDIYKAYLDGEVDVDESSGVKLAPYPVSGTSLQPSGTLPSSYRTETTAIRDQGSYNTCWAFSGLGALEAFLSSEGRGNFDFSESHLAWWSTAQYNSNGIGWLSKNLAAGGYSMISSGYLTSWEGPKPESEIPYGSIGSGVPSNMDSASDTVHVTGIIYVDNNINSLKTAIYRYGAVATSYNSGNGYSNYRKCYYQSNEVTTFSGHAITVIGWDDDYPKENFKSGQRPPSNGAWLVKNSWGSDVGDNGYLWISYYDRYIFDTETWGANLAFTGARTAREYDRIYQNETYGATYHIDIIDNNGREVKKATFVNVFDFDSEHSNLEEIIFQNENQGASYAAYYIPVVNGLPVKDKSQWQYLKDGTIDSTGYINVKTPGATIPSGKGAIGITIDCSGKRGCASFGVDEWLTDVKGEFLFKPLQARNESFVITDGCYDLVDIYAANDDKIGGTLIIKAVTSSHIIGDVDGDGESTTSDAVRVLRYSVGLENFDSNLLTNADVTFDGEIDSFDAVTIQRKSIDIFSEY